jgi:hypothetical protein
MLTQLGPLSQSNFSFPNVYSSKSTLPLFFPLSLSLSRPLSRFLRVYLPGSKDLPTQLTGIIIINANITIITIIGFLHPFSSASSYTFELSRWSGPFFHLPALFLLHFFLSVRFILFIFHSSFDPSSALRIVMIVIPTIIITITVFFPLPSSTASVVIFYPEPFFSSHRSLFLSSPFDQLASLFSTRQYQDQHHNSTVSRSIVAGPPVDALSFALFQLFDDVWLSAIQASFTLSDSCDSFAIPHSPFSLLALFHSHNPRSHRCFRFII